MEEGVWGQVKYPRVVWKGILSERCQGLLGVEKDKCGYFSTTLYLALNKTLAAPGSVPLLWHVLLWISLTRWIIVQDFFAFSSHAERAIWVGTTSLVTVVQWRGKLHLLKFSLLHNYYNLRSPVLYLFCHLYPSSPLLLFALLLSLPPISWHLSSLFPRWAMPQGRIWTLPVARTLLKMWIIHSH